MIYGLLAVALFSSQIDQNALVTKVQSVNVIHSVYSHFLRYACDFIAAKSRSPAAKPVMEKHLHTPNLYTAKLQPDLASRAKAEPHDK